MRMNYIIGYFKPFMVMMLLLRGVIKTLNINDEYVFDRPPSLTIKQRCVLLLLKQLIEKNNRKMALLTLVFSALTNIHISYKTIERLYSDEKIALIFNQLHNEFLSYKIDKSKIDLCEDGTGYSLTISRYYASKIQKLKNKLKDIDGQHSKKSKKKKQVFVYSFQLLDIKIRIYINYETSFKNEQKAYFKAIKMAEKLNIKINSIKLDKYYSKQISVKYLADKNKRIKFYLIPQKNAKIKECLNWKRM